MDVRELNFEQLSYLKQCLWFADDDNWFYDQLSNEDKLTIDGTKYWDDIPNDIVFKAYEGISFVEEDF